MGPLPYPPGAILSFPTKPLSRYSPPETGRFAVVKVLGHDDAHGITTVAVLDHVSSALPALADVTDCGCMVRRADTPGPPQTEMIVGLLAPSDPNVVDFTLLGNVALSRSERLSQGFSFLGLDQLGVLVEAIWRQVHDGEAFEAELERVQADVDARLAAEETRRRERLRGLTIDALRAEELFPDWAEMPDLIPPWFLEQIRERARLMLSAIASFEPTPPRQEVRAAMRAFVEWINEANVGADHEIVETSERETLCLFLEEVAWAAKQPELADAADEWRDW